MKIKADIFPQVLLVLVVWTLPTIGIAALQSGGSTPTEELVKSGLMWSVFVAMVFALGAISFWKIREEIGLTGVVSDARWWVIIPPVIGVVILLANGLSSTSFSTSVICIVLMNTLFVGISEEAMFRGMMLSGTFNRFSYWQAILLTSVTFGFVHSLNGFITGNFAVAALQAVTATFSGLLFMAIRLGMGSIVPAMILHGLWDGGLVLTPGLENATGILGYLTMAVVIAGPWFFGLFGIFALFRLKSWVEGKVGCNGLS